MKIGLLLETVRQTDTQSHHWLEGCTETKYFKMSQLVLTAGVAFSWWLPKSSEQNHLSPPKHSFPEQLAVCLTRVTKHIALQAVILCASHFSLHNFCYLYSSMFLLHPKMPGMSIYPWYIKQGPQTGHPKHGYALFGLHHILNFLKLVTNN